MPVQYFQLSYSSCLGGMLSRSTGAVAQSHIRDLSILVARGCEQFARRATSTRSSRKNNKLPLVLISQRAFSVSNSTPTELSTSAPTEESTPTSTSSPRRPVTKTSPTNEVRFFSWCTFQIISSWQFSSDFSSNYV